MDTYNTPGPSGQRKDGNIADQNFANIEDSNNGGQQQNASSNNANMNDLEIFKEICGIDSDAATQLLQESGGNLEAAIHQFFYLRDNPEFRRRRGDQADPNGEQGPPPEQQQPIVQRRIPTTWAQWLHALAMLPFRFVFSTFAECLLFFYNLLVAPPTRNIIAEQNAQVQAIQQQNIIQDRILMRQQQSEYERALAIDRQKSEKRKRLEEKQKEEEKKAKEAAERLEARAERMKQKKAEINKASGVGPTTTDQGLVQIRVSFPNGVKVVRKFRQDDSLERLFEFVFVQKDCPDNFSLLTSFPSTLLNCEPRWYKQEFEVPSPIATDGIEQQRRDEQQIKTFAEQGLLTSAVIMVRDNDA